MTKSLSQERTILAILATVQFTSIVDFMVIMPLGPQLGRTLGLDPTRFGLVVSSYTFAAGLAGMAASTLLDRFARRPAFLTLYSGFLAGTLACGLANSYGALLAARFLTGSFGGILGGMSMAIIGDVFPEERRGAATGALMSAFALASIAGVPIGLELGLRYDWHAPFLVLAVLGLPILFLAATVLPRLDEHLGRSADEDSLARIRETLTHPNHIRAFGLTVTMMFGSFSVVPFLSPYLVSNVGLSEHNLPLVYIVGGVLTLVGAPIIGRLADRFGKLQTYRTVAPMAAAMMILLTNMPPVPVAVAVICFGGMMLCNAGRMIPAMAMITSSVEPHRRGGFQAANSAIQHMASGVGAAIGGVILTTNADGALVGYWIVGLMGAGATIASLWFAGRLRIADYGRPISTAEAIGATEAAMDADDPVVRIEV
jgi:predicted MFS family arabinose efflux permease